MWTSNSTSLFFIERVSSQADVSPANPLPTTATLTVRAIDKGEGREGPQAALNKPGFYDQDMTEGWFDPCGTPGVRFDAGGTREE